MTTDGLDWARPSHLTEQCEQLYGLKCPPLWGPPRRLYYPTYGPHVARVMTALGSPPMPWQRYMLDVALEVEPDTGLPAYREVDLSVMRQQGKTEAVGKGLPFWRMLAWPDQGVMYSAQTRNDARAKLLKDFWESVAASPLRHKFKLTKQLGSEEIAHWPAAGKPSRWNIMANTDTSGHGGTLDLAIIDEAMAHADNTNEQAVNPAMVTRASAQLWVTSAAGTEESYYWNTKRQAGRELIERLWNSGLTEWPSVCYLEWFPSSDELARDDPRSWWDCMPALGHTITEATIKAELAKAASDPDGYSGFDRAYMNRTAHKRPAPDLNVPVAEFRALADHETALSDQFALAIDVAADRQSSTSIAAYGLTPDGRDAAELLDYRPGVRWAIPRLLTLVERYRPVAVGIDDRGAASALISELEQHGLRRPKDPAKPRRGELVVMNAHDMARASGQLADAIRAGGFVHRGQRQLLESMDGARTRRLEGSWTWAQVGNLADITPVRGITVARFAWQERKHLLAAGKDVGVW